MSELTAGPQFQPQDELPTLKVPRWLRAIGAVVKKILSPKPR